MAKRKRFDNVSEQRVKASKKLVIPAVRRLQSQHPARIKYRGKVTGEWYEWARAGSIVLVDPRDADDLLSKMRNTQPCCGSIRKPQPKFVEV